VAAGAVVQPGVVVPAGELWAGNPAQKLRAVKPNETEYFSTVRLFPCAAFCTACAGCMVIASVHRPRGIKGIQLLQYLYCHRQQHCANGTRNAQ
jgi:hypothetical protein